MLVHDIQEFEIGLNPKLDKQSSSMSVHIEVHMGKMVATYIDRVPYFHILLTAILVSNYKFSQFCRS